MCRFLQLRIALGATHRSMRALTPSGFRDDESSHAGAVFHCSVNIGHEGVPLGRLGHIASWVI